MVGWKSGCSHINESLEIKYSRSLLCAFISSYEQAIDYVGINVVDQTALSLSLQE